LLEDAGLECLDVDGDVWEFGHASPGPTAKISCAGNIVQRQEVLGGGSVWGVGKAQAGIDGAKTA
jgi:hypothetical protein